MKTNLRISLLFAGVFLTSGAANAQIIRDDRYLELMQSREVISSKQLRTSQPRKRTRQARQLQTRAVAGHFADRAPASVTESSEASERKSTLGALIAAKAAAHGVSAELAHAVVRVESNYSANVTGRAGEVGLMQIKYQTARGLGYTGTRTALYEPATNLEWGMRYLAGAHRLARGNVCGTLAKYQGGHGASRSANGYCGRVRNAMAAARRI